jgi:curved DNA-binding protein CbpA
MGLGITWYDALGVLPDAAVETIHRTYDAKTDLLRPELIAGAPSMVVTAAARAQGILDAGWRVLGDPVSRERYDEAAGLRHSGGGLTQDRSFPSYPGWESSDFGFVPGDAGAGVLGGLMALADWLAPHPREPRRIEVPDIRGLFYSAGQAIAGKLDLRVTLIRLTEHPMPVDGLVVGQSPRPAAKARRASELTLQVWHPPVRPTK